MAAIEGIPPEALLDGYPGSIREIAQALRTIVRRAEPAAIEAVRPGWRLIGYDLPLTSRRSIFFCYVAPEPGHAHLGFPRGVTMDDPAGVLLGAGVTRQTRWITLRPGDAILEDTLEALVREAARVGRMSSEERALRTVLRAEGSGMRAGADRRS